MEKWEVQTPATSIVYIAMLSPFCTERYPKAAESSSNILLPWRFIISMKALLVILLLSSLSLSYDWTKLEDKINYYQFNGAFSGGVLRVANGTHNIYTKAIGSFTHNNLPYSSIPFTNDTIFDLASLTKVTATLACIMHLADQGRIAVDDLVSKYIPEYANHGKEPTLLRNLLLHNAGLEPDYPGALPKTKQEVMHWTYNCSLSYPIGTKMVYSDLSFILLGEISERVTGKPLDVYTKELMQEMGMPNSTYLPDLEHLLHRIAPTEYNRTSSLIQHQEGRSFEGKSTIPLPISSEESQDTPAYSQSPRTSRPTCRSTSTKGFTGMER